MSDTLHYHFIGIGGIGMSGIAKVLISRQFSVSGSDVLKNDPIKTLCDNGAIIFDNQNQKNIDAIFEKLLLFLYAAFLTLDLDFFFLFIF